MFTARISSPKQFEIIDAPVPEAQDGQCLIKLESWSVCGSDIRHGYGPVYPEEQYPMRLGAPCHEAVGTIVESRSDRFTEGQRVIVLPGRETGALVEYMAGQEDRMIALPDEGTPDEWIMCQPSGTVLYSVQQAGTILGKRVVVMGQGGIGLSFTAICSRAGARQVIAVDPLDHRLEFSKRFGATHTINPSTENLDEAIDEITGGQGAEVSIEAAGFPDTLNNAFRHVSKFGKVIIFGVQGGLPGDMTPLNFGQMFSKTPTIIPTVGATSGDAISHIENMVELKQRGWWNPAEMVTHTMPFDHLKDAYDMYENYEDGVVKIVLSA